MRGSAVTAETQQHRRLPRVDQRDSLCRLVLNTRALGLQPRELVVATGRDLLTLDSQRHPALERIVLTKPALGDLGVDAVTSGDEILDPTRHDSA